MQLRTFAYLALAAFLAIPRSAPAQGGLGAQSQLQASYDFLVKEREQGGALFSFTTATGSYLLPHSFYDTPAYGGAYVCGSSSAACAINDRYKMLDYQLSPAPGAAGKLQVERANAHSGANIYDAATWQIAVVLGFVKNKLTLSSSTSAYALASSLSDVLRQSAFPPDENSDCVKAGRCKISSAPGTRRATTAGNTFVYNGAVVTEGNRAFAFRAFASEWIARDPLMGSPFASFITASNLPLTNAAYSAGKITWSDWKPITGENAWAFLIGPPQAAHLHYVVFKKEKFVPFAELAVQNALDVLPTFAAMQSAVGGVY